VDDLAKSRLQKAMELIPRVHELDREGVFILHHTANAAPIRGDERGRLVPGHDRGAGVADVADQRLARATRPDSRQIRPEIAAAAVDPMTAPASIPEHPLAILCITRRWRWWYAWGQGPQIRERRPDLIVRHAARRHRAARNAAAHRLEEPLLADRCRP